jgi:tetratricopeptide (TPR) repeat protein
MRLIRFLLLLALLLPGPASAHTDSPLAGLTAKSFELLKLQLQAANAENEGRVEEAEQALRRLLELTELGGGNESVNPPFMRNILALFYERNGRPDDAERLLKQDLANREILALFYERNGRLDDAEQLLKEVSADRQLGFFYARNGRLEDAERLLKQDPADRDALIWFYEVNRRFDEAERLLKQDIEIFKTTPVDDLRSQKAYEVGQALVEFYKRRHRFADAEATLRWIAEHLSALPDDRYAALLNVNFAALYVQLRRFPEAMAYEQRAFAWLTDINIRIRSSYTQPRDDKTDRDRIGWLDDARYVHNRLKWLAEFHIAIERPDLADSTYSRLLDLSGYRDDILEGMVNLYMSQNNYSRAVAVQKKIAYSLYKDIDLAKIYEKQGHRSEAEQVMRSETICRDIIRRRESPLSSSVGQDCLPRMAELYVLQGRHADAEPLFERALAMHLFIPQTPGHLIIARATLQKKHGDTLKALGRQTEAQTRYDRVERTLKHAIQHSYGEDDSTRLAAHLQLAQYYAEWSRDDEALSAAQKILTVAERHYGADAAWNIEPLDLMVDILARQGALAQARDYARRALAIREWFGPDRPDTQKSRTALQNIEAQIRGAPVPKAN